MAKSATGLHPFGPSGARRGRAALHGRAEQLVPVAVTDPELPITAEDRDVVPALWEL